MVRRVPLARPVRRPGWSAGAQGEAGPAGAQGAAGPAGAQGPQGLQGIQGIQGPAGPAGPQGPAGNDGAQGPQGPAGNNGAQGPQGPAGNNGAQGPQGPAGNSFTWQGAWSSTTSYAVRDVVNYQGTAYISKTANTNKTPNTNPTDWDVMVAKTTIVRTATATGNSPQATASCPAGMVATGGGANAVGATTTASLVYSYPTIGGAAPTNDQTPDGWTARRAGNGTTINVYVICN